MNPFDELSVEESVRIRDKKRAPGGVEDICAISAGPAKSADVLRTAMAMGADRAIHVELKDGEELEPLTVAKMLRAAAEREKSNLIILGKQSIDDDAAQTGQMLAGLLGWSQATQASKVEFGEGDSVLVTKEVDGGVETVKGKLPMVVTTDLRLNEPRYATLPAIMKAKKKKLEKVKLGDFGVEAISRLKTLKVTGKLNSCVTQDARPSLGGIMTSVSGFYGNTSYTNLLAYRAGSTTGRRQGRGCGRAGEQAEGAWCSIRYIPRCNCSTGRYIDVWAAQTLHDRDLKMINQCRIKSSQHLAYLTHAFWSVSTT